VGYERNAPKREVIACHPSMGPVIGIAEAAMHAASFIATGFSIVTTLARTCVIARHLVETYGMARHCRNIRVTELPVLALEEAPQVAYQTILTACQHALVEDGSGAIILGCAGMTDLADAIQQEIGVPVIDGVGAAVKFVEALVGLGLRTSKVGDLAYPLPKSYTGALAPYAPAPIER